VTKVLWLKRKVKESMFGSNVRSVPAEITARVLVWLRAFLNLSLRSFAKTSVNIQCIKYVVSRTDQPCGGIEN
jgi:hypothetical protein